MPKDHIFPILQLGAIGEMTQSIYRLLGQEWFIDDFGVFPAFGLVFGTCMIIATLLMLRPSFSSIRSTSSSYEGITSNEREDKNDLVAEAARQLQLDGEEISQENLNERIEKIETDQDGHEKDGRTGAIWNRAERSESARLSVSPDRIIESESYIKRLGDQGEERLARALLVSNYPNRVAPGWLDKLFTSGLSTAGAEVRVSYHILPRDSASMKRKLDVRATRLTAQIQRKKRDGDLNTIEQEHQLEHIERLRQGITEGSTKLFDFALYFEILAENETVLNEATQELKKILSQTNARATPLYDRQLEAQRAMAPLGSDPIKNTQVMDLDALSTTFPFTDHSIVQSSGVLAGFHMTTNTPIVVDRFEQSGHNMLISGKIGSGKSYLAKLIMWRRLMMDPETEVLIIDPVGGFGDIVSAVEGQRVTVEGQTRINPLEIQQVEDLSQVEGNPYDDKLRSVMGLFKTHFAGERELSKEEEGVLRRAIRYAYLEKGITKNIDTHHRQSPTIQAIIDVLSAMAEGRPPEEFLDVPSDVRTNLTAINTETTISDEDLGQARQEANRIADYAHSVLLGLEDFKQGGQQAHLNGETNVRLQDRVVQFDLSSVADGQNEGLIMHIVLDWLFQRAKSNDGNMIVMIDEAHYMLGHDQALDMLNLFARHSRHYGSGLTLISQTVDEFMNSPKAKEIYDQCDIRALMRHQDIGSEAVEALNLTERERDFVLQAQAGNSASYSECLMYVTNSGKMRMRVLSNDFEHHVIDDEMNVWAFLYENDMVDWDDIPSSERAEVEESIRLNQYREAL